MSLAQENFVAACKAAHGTLFKLSQQASPLHRITLDDLSADELQEMAWHLEAISASIHRAINDQTKEGPVDLG